jgi:adenine-specific DNA-methyltransferase
VDRKARTLRQRPTDAESALWRQVRLRQIEGYKFRRQHPIGPYIVDFVCLERQVIVEVDGGQHALQVQQDAERTAWLERSGYRVMRFWDHEVLTELESVKEAIRRSFTPPAPSPPDRVRGRLSEGIHKERGGVRVRRPFPPGGGR